MVDVRGKTADELLKISVIITAYNIENYIAECIDSVLSQNFQGVEIICVDDCSTDGTAKVICNYQDRGVRLIKHKKNEGLAKSRVTGFSNAHGKYIYIMDGDDCLSRNALTTMYEYAEKDKLDLLTFSGEVFYDDKTMKAKYEKDRYYYIRRGNYDCVSNGQSLFCAFVNNGDMNGNMVFLFLRKDYIKNIGYIGVKGIRYGESPLGLYLAAKRAKCIPDTLYRRRFRRGSDVTTPFNQVKVESMLIQYLFDLRVYRDCCGNECKEIELYLKDKLRNIASYYKDLKLIDKKEKLLKNNNEAIFLKNEVIRYLNIDKMYCDLLTDDILKIFLDAKNRIF